MPEISLSEIPQEESKYADAYIQYMGIVRDKSYPNWEAYLREARLCYKLLSKDTQELVDAILSPQNIPSD